MPELKVDEVLQGSVSSYQIMTRIKAGGYGVVFQARDQRSGQFVIIKQMLAQSTTAESDFVAEVNRFRREAEILTRLANDPRIVKGHELIDNPTNPVLVMEMINGRDLAAELKDYMGKNNSQPMVADYVVPIGVDLCGVIDYLHRLPSQIIYRDLKPDNVMWDAVNKRVRLIDFGTARFSSNNKKVTVALGTPGYAPPELFKKTEEVSFAADVYTIGATLYELLTGVAPYDVSPMEVRNFRGYDPKIPIKLQEIVLRALKLKASERFQTASEMAAALQALPGYSAAQPLELSRARNPYPILCCFCPQCGNPPRQELSTFCPKDGKVFHAAILKVMTSNNSELRSMDLFINGDRALVGRMDSDENIFPDLDLSRFDDGLYVSRRHAMIERKGASYYLTHVGATNRTKVDGNELTKDRPVELKPGARIEFADLIANFETHPIIVKAN
jgi:serine/threonine protein kinase